MTDDRPGFSDKLLQKKTALFYSEDTSGKHLGLGLAVSRMLCQKHGGTIELSNRSPHGACVKASIAIKRCTLSTAWIPTVFICDSTGAPTIPGEVTIELSRDGILRHYDVIDKERPYHFVKHPDAWEGLLNSLTYANAF